MGMSPEYAINSAVCNSLKCGLLNCQSVGNKAIYINSLINEFSYDLFFVTETWLNGASPAIVAEMTPKTHSFLRGSF